MQKIKDRLVQKIIKTKIPKSAICILLDLINFAAPNGDVEIHYTDLTEVSGFSKTQVYYAITTLADTHFITKTKNPKHRQELLIHIVDNDFDSTGYCDYINTDTVFFNERFFSKLKAGEIRLYLYNFFRISKAKFKSKNPGKHNKLYNGIDYDTLAAKIGVSQRSITQYIYNLDSQGLICYARDKVSISNRKADVLTMNAKSTKQATTQISNRENTVAVIIDDTTNHAQHLVKRSCKRLKITFDSLSIADTGHLIRQYRNKCSELKKDAEKLLIAAINVISQTSNVLNARAVHAIYRDLIYNSENKLFLY